MSRKRKKPAPEPPHRESAVLPIAIAAVSLLAFLALSVGNIVGNAPTMDEPVHLAAGWSYLTTGDFRLNPEHPPLLKMIGALPLRFARVWPAGLTDSGDGARSFASLRQLWEQAPTDGMAQWFLSHRLFYSLRDSALQRLSASPETVPTTAELTREDFLNNPERLFLGARIVLLLFSGVGLAAIIFFWSKELWGLWGAALSVMFFAFDPNFIAHSGLVTTDAGVSFLMAGTLYFFWRTWRAATPINIALFALFFGAAMVAKFSAVLLIPILALITITVGRKQIRRLALALIAAALFAVVAIWAIYGFRFAPTGAPLPVADVVNSWYAKKSLVAQYPAGPPADVLQAAMQNPQIGIVGKTVLLANRARLLPQPYLMGFAIVQDSAMFRQAYLRGRLHPNGHPSFFFWTFLYKTPLPAIAAVLAGLFVSLSKRKAQSGVWFAFIPAGFYFAVAVLASINIGHRHLLPVFPFLYVLTGALSRRFVIAGALAATSCLWSFNAPMWGRHLSYVNELGGGPRNGSEVLVDSSFDWGQDLERLGTWARENQIVEPINLVYFGAADPRYYGIRFVNLPLGYYAAPEVPITRARVPGWFAISSSDLVGATLAIDNRDYWRNWLAQHNAKLAGKAGYSIFIYRVD